MIRIVQGPPGSGKSYYMCAYLKNFTKYDEFYDEFILKDDVLIISNISGLRVKHLNLEDCIDRYTVEKFFTVENFEEIQKKYRAKSIILLIDETQRIFDSAFYANSPQAKKVLYFFQYHRHLGVDIVLATQSVSTISRHLIPLAEYVIDAVPRSKSVFGSFSYKFRDTKGTFLYSKTLRKEKRIFQYYKSFDTDEIAKPKNVLAHWAIFGLVAVVASLALFNTAIAGIKAKSERAKAHAVSSQYQPVYVNSSSLPAPGSRRSDPAESSRPIENPKPKQQPTKLSPARVSKVVPSRSKSWVSEKVESMAQVNQLTLYKIRGRWIPGDRCRNYDEMNDTIEVYKES